MKKLSANADNERFRNGADRYAAYLETPEGRLRLDLAFANLQEFLPARRSNSLSALDLGCGTGATAVRLARLGVHVTLLDSSPVMLDIAKRSALDAGVSGQVTLQQGDATELSSLFNAESFDVVLCHNLLEYVDDPSAVLCGAARMMQRPSAMLSVLVRNQAGEVLKAAIKAGDLAAAENNLTAEWGKESLYGGRVRLFTSDGLPGLLKSASLAVVAERGVRVVSDYLPQQVCQNSEYERIFELERKLGRRSEFAAVARYRQYLIRCADPGIGDRA
jgi:S-adenosylmethionine-dependent methyltransferase